MTPGFTVENTVPASGEFSYTNSNPVTVKSLPVESAFHLRFAGRTSRRGCGIRRGRCKKLRHRLAPRGRICRQRPARIWIPVTGAKQFFRLTLVNQVGGAAPIPRLLP